MDDMSFVLFVIFNCVLLFIDVLQFVSRKMAFPPLFSQVHGSASPSDFLNDNTTFLFSKLIAIVPT